MNRKRNYSGNALQQDMRVAVKKGNDSKIVFIPMEKQKFIAGEKLKQKKTPIK